MIAEPLALELPRLMHCHHISLQPSQRQLKEINAEYASDVGRCHGSWTPRVINGRHVRSADLEVRNVTKMNLREIMVNIFEMLANSEESMQSLISNQNGRTLQHTPPTHSPDSDGLTPSSRRALPRRRIDRHSPILSEPQNDEPHFSTPPLPQNNNQLLPSPNIHSRPRRQNRQLPRRYRSPEIPYDEQPKLCQRNPHEKPRSQFIEAGMEYDICNQCRQEIQQWRERQEEPRQQQQQSRSTSPESEIDEEIQRHIQNYLNNERNGMLFVTTILIFSRSRCFGYPSHYRRRSKTC